MYFSIMIVVVVDNLRENFGSLAGNYKEIGTRIRVIPMKGSQLFLLSFFTSR